MNYCWTAVKPAPEWTLHLAATDAGLLRLCMASTDEEFLASLPPAPWKQSGRHPTLSAAAEQLREYFRGQRSDFDLKLDLRGTPFQKRIWQCLREIPYGSTWSYAQLAERAGSPRGCRAAGQANGRNPIAIIVPCHRVIAADGSLGGFSSGLDYKIRLLALEARSTMFSKASSSSTTTPMRSQHNASGATN